MLSTVSSMREDFVPRDIQVPLAKVQNIILSVFSSTQSHYCYFSTKHEANVALTTICPFVEMENRTESVSQNCNYRCYVLKSTAIFSNFPFADILHKQGENLKSRLEKGHRHVIQSDLNHLEKKKGEKKVLHHVMTTWT